MMPSPGHAGVIVHRGGVEAIEKMTRKHSRIIRHFGNGCSGCAADTGTSMSTAVRWGQRTGLASDEVGRGLTWPRCRKRGERVLRYVDSVVCSEGARHRQCGYLLEAGGSANR